LQSLEPRLRKITGIDSGIAERAVAGIQVHQLRGATTADELSTLWKNVPRALLRRSDVVTTYARAAMAFGEHAAAETELLNCLHRRWDEAAVLALGELQTQQPLQTLERAEHWLGTHPQHPTLLLSCARLAIHAELYGKARSYLETMLAIQPRLEGYQLLAELLEQLGERDRALKVCMDGMVHALGGRTRSPRVRINRWLEQRRGEARRI
jgi:HemY protein